MQRATLNELPACGSAGPGYRPLDWVNPQTVWCNCCLTWSNAFKSRRTYRKFYKL